MSEWQPIETAPKNKAIIVYAGRRIGEACYISNPDLEGWWWADDLDRMARTPTRWMPLPPAPAREREGV